MSKLVSRFNREGPIALEPRYGGGEQVQYDPAEQDRNQAGTATWSLTTLQRALRQAPDGLAQVSTYTIWQVLHEAGLFSQGSSTWSKTGQVERQRKAGVVMVTVRGTFDQMLTGHRNKDIFDRGRDFVNR